MQTLLNKNGYWNGRGIAIVAAFLIPLVLCTTGCAQDSDEFMMTVDQVDELKGMILKGISISGKVQAGCIANDDEYIVTRDGNEILKTTARILNVKDLKDPDAFNGEVFKDDYVTLYIPDGKKLDVIAGDILTSNAASCGAAVSANDQGARNEIQR